jgi:hypothetical protein
MLGQVISIGSQWCESTGVCSARLIRPADRARVNYSLALGVLLQNTQKQYFIAIVINMFRLAEAYATAKIPLSPFRKGGTQLALSRMNAQIETTKLSGQSVPPFEKGGTGGILNPGQTEQTSERCYKIQTYGEKPCLLFH